MDYIDISAAVHQRAGLGRYSQRLAQALIAAHPDRFALFFNRGRAGKVPEALRRIPSREVRAGYKPWRSAILMGHMARIPFNRLVPGARLFHSTEHLLMPLRGVPTVLTVHDLIFRRFPAYHKRLNYWYLNMAMPLYCARATAIVAVSEASKRDIVQYYGIDPAKIHVVYEAAAPIFRPPAAERIEAARQEYRLPAKFLIHLGTIEPRKNLNRLLDAMSMLRSRWPDLQLVLAGGKGWLYDDFFNRLAREGASSWVRVLGWVPDEDLPAVIAAADLAVQPSLYEGFGLPILEHMASGQVVAASQASSHPEVGGEAAAYFQPTESEDMTAVIHHLLSDRDEYHHRRQLGIEQASRFSWSRAAHETLQLYDQLLT